MGRLAVQPGELFAQRYRLIAMIGAGGMGAVWSARDERKNRDVALKFLHPSMLADPVIIQRFLLEARATAGAQHEALVEVLDSGKGEVAGSKETIPYLAMEL